MTPAQLPSGVFAASLTPLTEEEKVDDGAFSQHVEWLLREGCDGCLLFGTTGEGLSFTVEERRHALEAVLSKGRFREQLLVGTGALPLPDAVRLTRHATNQGVGGVLVLPAFHFRNVREEGVFRFYDQLIQQVGEADLRLYLYHFPELSGVSIPFSVIERLRSAYPSQIAGIKDSSGEWDHTEALCRDFPELQVFSGTERLLLPTLRAGGAGCISDTANVTSALAANVYSAWMEGESPDLLQESLRELRTSFAPLPTIQTLKRILSQVRGLSMTEAVRPPLTPLSDEEKSKVDALQPRLEEKWDLPKQ